MGPSRQRADAARRFVAAHDPDLLSAAGEVDRSLLTWALSLDLRERLHACTNAARCLGRFQRVAPEDR